MQYPRFFCDTNWPQHASNGVTFQPPKAVSHHMAKVLRVRTGDTVDLFNDQGAEWRCTVIAIDKQPLQVQFEQPIQRQTESPLHTVILQAVSRGDRMDYTVQKATELGMHEFIPVLTQRVGVKLDAKRWAKKVQHWQGVAISACEQSGRQRVPHIHSPVSLSEAMQTVTAEQRLMLEIDAARPLASALQPALTSLALLVGPEGDFTDNEIQQAKAAGFDGIQIGPRILRTETVAPTVLAVAQSLSGDWREPIKPTYTGG